MNELKLRATETGKKKQGDHLVIITKPHNWRQMQGNPLARVLSWPPPLLQAPEEINLIYYKIVTIPNFLNLLYFFYITTIFM